MRHKPLNPGHPTTLPDLAARLDMAERMKQQGSLRFDEWMRLALYHPDYGYYSKGERIFGAGGDFVTAPVLSTLFGRTLAKSIAETFKQVQPVIYEFGAGQGHLATQILSEVGEKLEAYCIVDLSGALQAQQAATLKANLPEAIYNKVKWLDHLPETLKGWVIGNELLDAMPVRRFGWQSGHVTEYHVMLDRQAGADFPVFTWLEKPAPTTLNTHVHTLAQHYGPWPSLYQSEVGEQAFAWVRTITQRLQGYALMIDYGRDASQYYAPQQNQGFLRAHSQHVAHDGVFEAIGLQDLTCHVDFSAVYNAFCEAGADLEGYCTQSAFLRHHGILDMAQAIPEWTDPVVGGQQRQALNMLLSEAEMGENFKVICWSRGCNLEDTALQAGFLAHDLSHQL